MAYDELIRYYTTQEASQKAELAKSKQTSTDELRDYLAGAGVYGSGKLVRGYGAIESGYESALANISSKYGLTIAQLKEQQQREKNAKWVNLMKGGLALVGAGVGIAAGNPMLGAEVGSILGSGISSAMGWETGASIPSEILQMASSIPTKEEKANTELNTKYINSYINYLDAQINALNNPTPTPTAPAQTQSISPIEGQEGIMNYKPLGGLFELDKIRSPISNTEYRTSLRQRNRKPAVQIAY